MKTVPITMPDWIWGRLVTIADERNIPVAGLVADTLRQVLDDNPRVRRLRLSRLEVLEDELLAAKASGWKAPGTHTSKRSKA